MRYIAVDTNTGTKKFMSIFEKWTQNTDYYMDEDHVFYNNDIYRCAINHNSGTFFDDSKWTLLNSLPYINTFHVESAPNTRSDIMRDFIIPTYKVGVDELKVYADGLRMNINEDYLEIDQNHVRFLVDVPITRSLIFEANNGIGKIGGSSDASQITYDDPTYTTVKAALDKLLYVMPKINSFSNNINIVELGTVVNNITFNWSLNKPATSIILDGITLDPSLTAKTFTLQNVTSDRTYILTVSDGSTSISASTSVMFRTKSYFGTSTKDTLVSSDVLSLSSQYATSRAFTNTFACNDNYIYFAYLKSLGPCTIKTNGLLNTAFVETDINVTNGAGYTDTYSVYRSPYTLEGNILVEVS